jgi:hypothetical protein
MCQAFPRVKLVVVELCQLCLSGFSLLATGQAPEANNLKEERFVWLTVSEVSLRGYLVPLLLGLWQDRSIMVEECGRRKQLSSWLLESRERKTGSARDGSTLQRSPCRNAPPPTNIPLTCTTFSKFDQIMNPSVD